MFLNSKPSQLDPMAVPSSSLTVVFSDSPKIDDHLFAKAIRWADQNPEDSIFWARRKPIDIVPNVDVDWSTKVSALRRIRFRYHRKNFVASCIDDTIKHSLSSDAAAIICSTSLPDSGSAVGSLLAALAHFCVVTEGRAVLAIDLREVEEVDEEPEDRDPFENSDLFDEEQPEELKNPERNSEKLDRNRLIEKMKTVSKMFTDNVFTYDGKEFNPCL